MQSLHGKSGRHILPQDRQFLDFSISTSCGREQEASLARMRETLPEHGVKRCLAH